MKNGLSSEKRKGVYLVVVDTTEELSVAIDYAAHFANAEGGYIALLNVMEDIGISNFKDIEDRMKAEQRAQAEHMIWEAAGRVIEKTGKTPMTCIEQGDRSTIIIDMVEGNKNIVALVLASDASSSNPGALVSYFSGKGLSRLPVPLLIVPGHLEAENIGDA